MGHCACHCHLVSRLDIKNMNNVKFWSVPSALWQWPVAPLKNEKAGLFCCSQISTLLKNPIKMQWKVTFPFTVMTHGQRNPVMSEMGGVHWWGGFRPERKGDIDWLNQHSISCTLSITSKPFSLLFFFLLDASYQKQNLLSPSHHLTPLLRGRQPGNKGDSHHPPAGMDTTSWSHPSYNYLFSLTPTFVLSYSSFFCGYSIAVSTFPLL